MLDLFPRATGPTLRDYQEQCLNAITQYHAQGGRRALVALPTGTGKTVIFAQLPELFPGGKMLVLAHREELLDQAYDKITAANPQLRVQIEQAERRANENAVQVLVASVQTFAVSPGRLSRFNPGEFSVIVVDEAHHATAPTYRKVLAYFGLTPEEEPVTGPGATAEERRQVSAKTFAAFKPDPSTPMLVGFTATPSRTDGGGLEWVFDRIVFARNITEMIEGGWLCRIRARKIATGTNLSGVHTRLGDYVESELSSVVNTPKRNALAVQSYLDHANGRQALVFAVDVRHTQDLQQAFREAGVQAGMVVGETPPDERHRIIADYQAGQIQVLVNCMVLTEGFDAPETSCIVMCRPTQSSLLYTQMMGRGTRLSPGKADLLVLDLVDIGARAGLQTVATLFGTPPDLNGEDILEVLENQKRVALEEEIEEELDRSRKATAWVQQDGEFDPLAEARISKDIAHHLKLDWHKIPSGYVLGLPGHGQVGVTMFRFFDQVSNESTLAYCRVAFRGNGGEQEVIGEFNKEMDALLAAEAWVKEEYVSLTAMLKKDALWRVANHPATEKQVKLLRWLLQGKALPEHLTKGQASAMIDRLKAVRGPRLATAAQKWRLRQEGTKVPPNLTFEQARKQLDELLGGK